MPIVPAWMYAFRSLRGAKVGMSTAPGMRSPLDPTSERQLAERCLHARRMHHRQILRRGLITALMVGGVAGLSFLLYPVMRHLRTSWYLTSSGLTVGWNIDQENWMTGGISSVDHNNRNWFPRPIDSYLKYLPDLLHLQTLNLSECDVSEKGLTELAPLGELRD